MNVNYFKQFWKSSLMMIMLCFGLTSWGQANLPFSFNGGRDDISSTTGLSHSGLGTDYNDSSTKLKFDHTGDFLTLHFNGIADELSFTIRFNGSGSFGGTYQVVGSTDGTNFDVSLFSLGAHTASSNVTYNVDNIPTNVKYIRWIYTSKSSGNIGLGNINLTGTAAPTCTTPEFLFDEEVVNKIVIDEPFTNEFISDNTSAFVWSSTDTDVATVDANGEVTIVGAGTTEIRVNQEADDTYCAVVDASYTLNVAAVTYAITATSNNEAFGTVSLAGNIITATPAAGYTYATPAYTVTEGSATVDQNGNEFTVTPSSDATVQINFEAMPLYTLSLVNDGSAYTEGDFPFTTYEGNTVTLPTLANCGTFTFVGWDTNSSTTSTPTYAGGATYTTTGANVTLYAVYSETVGTPETWERVTTLNDIVAGTYVILNGDFFLPNTNTGSSSAPSKVTITSKGVAINDNTLTGTIDSDMQWNFSGTNSAMSIVSAANAADKLYNTDNNNGVRVHTTTATWAFETYNSGFAMTTNSRYCAVYTDGNDWRSYTSRNHSNYKENNGILDIYKKSGGSTTTYTTNPGCDDPQLVVSETTLPDFTYMVGNGPSVSQEFEVSGINLDGSAIVVTAPANFEVSTDDETFAGSLNLSSTDGTLAETTVYVRLAAGLTADNYSGNITISGGDAPNVTVAVSGEVTPLAPVTTPTIDVTGIANGTDTYWNTAEITLATTTPGATIYYTTDDSEPTTASTEYTVAFDVTATTTIKAFAVADGLDDSEVATKIITITEPATATTPYDETFTNTLGDWTNHKLFGNPGFNGWVTSAQGVTVNGYSQGNTQAWLISPKFNAGANGLLLSFDYASQYQGNNLEIRISNNYSGYGNPGDATWTTVTTITENASSALVSSSLTEYLISTSGNTHIALVYADNSSWAMWRVSNLIINSVTPCDEENLTAGTIVASATEVPAGDYVNFSLDGASTGSGLSYQWQSSANGTDWSDIDGATAATYTATNITAATYFRAAVTCGVTTVASNSVHVTLPYCEAGVWDVYERISNFEFGDINNSSTAFYGYEDFTAISTDVQKNIATSFTVAIVDPYPTLQVLIWIDLNHDNDFEDSDELVYESPISANATVSGTITIPNTAINGNTRLRIRIFDTDYDTATPCGYTNHGQVEDYTVNILPAAIVWTTEGGWSNITGPTITDDAVIEGDLTLTGDLSAKTLTVAEGGKITVPANKVLTVDGAIINEAGAANFVVENDGILLQNTNASNTGAITVKRNSNPMFRLDYTLWSSPVVMNLVDFSEVSATSPTAGTGTLWNRVYTLGTAAWEQVWATQPDVNNDTTPFVAGQGYLYRSPNAWVIRGNENEDPAQAYPGVFTGVPNNGTVNAATPYEFSAIGNPYPSPIDADILMTENADIDYIYFWTNTHAPLDGSYDDVPNNWAYYNMSGGTATDGGVVPNGTIQPGQGFVAKMVNNTNTVNFNNGQRISSNNHFFRQMASERHRFWLNLSNSEEVVFNQILVGYMNNATQGIDTGMDAKMVAYEGNALYSVIENSDENYVIQGRSLPFTDSDVVALGFRAVNAGSFTISLANLDGLFADNQNIYLKDNFSQAVHNLKEGAYTFVSEEGVFNTRFEVVYQTTMSVENPVANNANWVVYSQENGFQVQTQGFELKTVQVFDLLGRTIYTANAQGTTHNIPSLGAESVYIVKVTSTENVVLSKKVK